jgi:hypothetical protein
MTDLEIIDKKYAEAVSGIKHEWLVTTTSEWYQYVANLPESLRITYLIVIFHNQVFNGGFHQYFANGYGQFAIETIDALIKIGAPEKAEILRVALKTVNVTNDSDAIFRERLLKNDIEALFANDTLFNPLNELDNQYYDNESEDEEQLLGNYLRQGEN